MVPAAASSLVSSIPSSLPGFTQLFYLQWVLKIMLEETALWATRNIRSLRRLHEYIEHEHPSSAGPTHEVTVKAFRLADRAIRQYSSYARQTTVLSDSVTRFRIWKDTSLEIARDLAERHTEPFLPIMNDLLSDDELDFCLFYEEDYIPPASEVCSEYDLWNRNMSATFVSQHNWLLPSDGGEVDDGDFDPLNGDEALAILSTLDELVRLCEVQKELNLKPGKTELEELNCLEKQLMNLFRKNIKILMTAGKLFASNSLPNRMLSELDTLNGEVATPTKTWLFRASILANAIKQKPRMPRSAILAILRHDPDDSDHSSDNSSVEAEQDTHTGTRPQTSIPTQFALRSNADSSLPAILEEDEPSSKQTTP
ncbi:uncharacterized protein STEHIDRAFT_138407, partial [Stereum hirsutum FP-91666 SS1]|uniref:uncharacterized protein n=1 Tax=Stereum hirsutum (strain FP-91666) TaxID=721885 RepID=UPI000440A8D1